MKDKTKIIILISFCLIFAILMIVGWVMYAKAKKDNSCDVTKKDNASDVTGLLVILSSSCEGLTTGGASVLAIPFDTCVDIGNDQYLKLIKSYGKYTIGKYNTAECTDMIANESISFNINDIGNCVNSSPYNKIAIANAYELYGPINPYLFKNNFNYQNLEHIHELLEEKENIIDDIKEYCTDHDSNECKYITNLINDTGNTYYQS